MFDICCVGHITSDKVVTTKAVVYMAGGTSIYFSNAIRNMDLKYILVTALGEKEMGIVSGLRAKGIRSECFTKPAHRLVRKYLHGEPGSPHTTGIAESGSLHSQPASSHRCKDLSPGTPALPTICRSS